MNFLIIAADVITALCAIVTVIIAYRAFRRWKSQIMWKVRFDFIREILPLLSHCEHSLKMFQSHSFGHKEIPINTIFDPERGRRLRQCVEKKRLDTIRSSVFRLDGYRIVGTFLMDSHFESLLGALVDQFMALDATWTNKEIQMELVRSGEDDLNPATQEYITTLTESMDQEVHRALSTIGEIRQLLADRGRTK